MLFEPGVSALGLQVIAVKLLAVVVVVADPTVKVAVLVVPLYVAETTTRPEVDDWTDAEKTAVLEPWGTVTLAGTTTAGLSVARLTRIAPAVLDKFTTHVVLPPMASFATAQLSEESVGVDQSARLADLDEAPSVLVITAVVSAAILPIEALNVLLVLPAGTITFAGTVARTELELIVMLVFVALAYDKATVQEMVAPDMTPAGVHANELICSAGAAS
jgi:hypothetical protein